MRARFDRLMVANITLENGKDLPPQKRNEQFRVLSEVLLDWGTAVFPDESYEWYQNFKEHGIFPYAGAYMDQPWYVQHDFRHWRMLEQWHRINEKLPSADGLPTFEQFIKGSNGHGQS
jgi:hypothetical protein